VEVQLRGLNKIARRRINQLPDRRPCRGRKWRMRLGISDNH
jgi:hypothetical protein